MNAEHRKKRAAPSVITVLFLVYLAVYGILIAAASLLLPVLILLAIPLVALGVGMVAALVARIKEIRSGEEDDLGNY